MSVIKKHAASNKLNKILLGITTEHNAKMQGMVSFSTSNICNSFCEKMKNVKGSICQKCFADKQFKAQPSTAAKMERNDWIKFEELSKEDIPFLNVAFMRFEAFGELATVQQLENYILIAKQNRHAKFALFTKRADLLAQVKTIPSNMTVNLSSPMIDKPARLSDKLKGKVHNIFTVYSKQAVVEEGVKINCGEKQCINCLRCYKRSKAVKATAELLK